MVFVIPLELNGLLSVMDGCLGGNTDERVGLEQRESDRDRGRLIFIWNRLWLFSVFFVSLTKELTFKGCGCTTSTALYLLLTLHTVCHTSCPQVAPSTQISILKYFPWPSPWHLLQDESAVHSLYVFTFYSTHIMWRMTQWLNDSSVQMFDKQAFFFEETFSIEQNNL